MKRRWLLLLPALLACVDTSLPTEAPVPDPDGVQRGALVFLDAGVSGDGSRSCNTCHPGGGSDGKTYAGGEPVELASPGALNPPVLRGLWQTPPYLWDGSAADLDAALDRMLAVEMRGGTLAPYDRAALLEYLRSLPVVDRARVEPDGTPIEPATKSAREGQEVYAKAGCPTCHAPTAYAHPWNFDVGTGAKYNPPTLRGVVLSPPYGHDGRWATIEDAIRAILDFRDVELSETEIHQLVQYVELL